ncbi:MAG: YggS family pyridoxal phosphate-dependent enzyme [Cytophagales bacterium]|nr:YggS family pyridoxal phosphate-dependent enzyme [Cytophagales bacterium]
MNLANNIKSVEDNLVHTPCKLVIVTKMRPIQDLADLYALGYKIFGENRVQDMVEKYEALPKDIEWHMIGHLQTNKVKYIAPFVSIIHSVDSMHLLQEIDKQAKKNNRTIPCLLQIYIAQEDTKYGLTAHEAEQILASKELVLLQNIKICGVMGMATFTDDSKQVQNEFNSLKNIFFNLQKYSTANINFTEISMGMSHDYLIAVQEGSTMVRIGSLIFQS